jgi:hypothetical protein
LKKTHHKNRAGGVVQGEGPEFKSQYCKKKVIKRLRIKRINYDKSSVYQESITVLNL